jgi:hypothetical protein
MKTLHSSALLAASLVTSVLGAGCSQPATECTVGRYYPYAAKYKLTAGEGSGPCAELPGDVIGMSAYNPTDADKKPILSEGSFAMRTGYVGGQVAFAEEYGVLDEAEDHEAFALGIWKSVFPDKDLCEPKDGMTDVVQALAEIPADEGDPEDPEDDFEGVPATALREEWSDVQFYVTAAAPGTQMSAHYKLTQDTCEAEYDVLAVYAAAYCEDENGEANDALCSPEPDPENGLVYGSGINPDFPVKCDPDLLLCVLDAAPGVALPVLSDE